MKDIEVQQIKIDKLISRIEIGEIKIPAFQRGFVWKQYQVIELLDSIYRDYPIGSLLFWETNEKRLEYQRNIGGMELPSRKAEYPISYVLDGQQRLSSLFAVFNHGRKKFKREKSEIGIKDYQIFNIYFDIENEKFILHSERDLTPFKPTIFSDRPNKLAAYLKLSDVISVSDFIDAIEKFNPIQREIAKKLHSKIINYEVPIVTISGRTVQEVGIIFERINNTGTELSTLDLVIAWTWSDKFNLRIELRNILNVLQEKGFGGLSEKILLQSLSAIMCEKITTEDILNSVKDVNIVKQKIVVLEDSLRKTIDFLRNELNVKSQNFLPSDFQIIPLVYFFSNVKKYANSQLVNIKKWFWRTSFSSRYRDGTNTRVAQDITIVKNIINNSVTNLAILKPEVTNPDFFHHTKFNFSATLTKAFILLLASNNPLDLVNGSKIDLEDTLSHYNSKEFHHIFPKAFLKKQKPSKLSINCLANYCLLPSYSNKIISDKAPSIYFFTKHREDLFSIGNRGEISLFDNSDIMNSNFLPKEDKLYKNNNFELFLSKRSKLLYQQFKKKIGTDT